MTQYRVAFNADTQVATLLLPEHTLPEGSEDVGVINASAVGPNPTDASTQHITTMLQRKGYSSFDRLTVTTAREPVKDVVEQEELPTTEENGEKMSDAILPGTLTLAVDEDHNLAEGNAKGATYVSSDEEIVKVGRGGKIKALKAGSATITVTNKEGLSNDVVVTVGESTPGSFAGVGTPADAKEAETA